MTRHRLSTTIYQLEHLTVEQLADLDDNVFWTVTDNEANILFRHQDRDIANGFAKQHLKMLKAIEHLMLKAEKQYKESTNA